MSTSVISRVLGGLRRMPKGFPADGRQLGLGLSAALDAQRARGAEPLDRPLDDLRGSDRAGGQGIDAPAR